MTVPVHNNKSRQQQESDERIPFEFLLLLEPPCIGQRLMSSWCWTKSGCALCSYVALSRLRLMRSEPCCLICACLHPIPGYLLLYQPLHTILPTINTSLPTMLVPLQFFNQSLFSASPAFSTLVHDSASTTTNTALFIIATNSFYILTHATLNFASWVP